MDAADRVLVELGKRVRDARKAASLSQQAAAIASQSDYRWWQRLEKGEINPTVRTLVKIAATLHVPIASLFPSK